MEEVWKPVVGYEDYEVSNLGRVYSKKSKIYLKPMVHRDGYLRVALYVNNKRQYKYIHQLVAQAHIPNPNNFTEINHLDRDKTRNTIDNLEWSSRTHNVQHSHGKVVQQYDINGNLINEFPSCHEAGRVLGIPGGSIWYTIQKSKNHCYNNFIWKYKNENLVADDVENINETP